MKFEVTLILIVLILGICYLIIETIFDRWIRKRGRPHFIGQFLATFMTVSLLLIITLHISRFKHPVPSSQLTNKLQIQSR